MLVKEADTELPEAIAEAIHGAEAKGDKPYTVVFAVLCDPGEVEGFSFSVMAPSPENAVVVGYHNVIQRYGKRFVDAIVTAVFDGLLKPVQFAVPANDVGLMEPKGTA